MPGAVSQDWSDREKAESEATCEHLLVRVHKTNGGWAYQRCDVCGAVLKRFQLTRICVMGHETDEWFILYDRYGESLYCAEHFSKEATSAFHADRATAPH